MRLQIHSTDTNLKFKTHFPQRLVPVIKPRENAFPFLPYPTATLEKKENN